MTQTLLSHRAVIEIAGPDAPVFLERVLTNEVAGHPTGETRYTALLTPQGKVLVDFLIHRVTDETAPHFFLDIPASEAEALTKRLKMFRLRADAVITSRDDLCVWHSEDVPSASNDAICTMRDPRHEHAGFRTLRARSDSGTAPYANLAVWNAARIIIGLPEFGSDFETAKVFPADINMDLLGGIDFKKGCFVGQEVVSRMHRRGKVRKRTLLIRGAETLATASVLNGSNAGRIGEVTSSAGNLALVRVRIDRLGKAEAAGETFTVDDAPVTFEKPDWLQSEIAALMENG
ncbi:MAG: folate-binding protein [Hyphomonadaceae bacterium]